MSAVDRLSLTANVIQVLTFGSLVIVSIVWRVSLIRKSRAEIAAMMFEAELRDRWMRRQMWALDQANQRSRRREGATRDGDVVDAMKLAHKHAEEFIVLLDRVGRKRMQQYYGRMSLKDVLVGFRYLNRRDELGTMLEKFVTLTDFTANLIDRYEKEEDDDKLAEICAKLNGLEDRVTALLQMSDYALKEKESGYSLNSIGVKLDEMEARLSAMQAAIMSLRKGE
ncbi:hypothetical protein K491DRAFT_778226 [Lophiostoma macrostomum CBS 122681]|uniref:Uncharacterized protein n=1 Tax=Lophiostoma macrostomum CBS 122681 TaxID=1314788 RepID=A0A6A6T7Z7_9PLEO|nr:hypothetical protein K491DRAFT_778226 [Lophiostoma macrostomum CBS 122681]